jgi:transposase, IS5 family
MPTKTSYNYVGSLFSTYEEQLDRTHPLYILANQIDWKVFDTHFEPLYSSKMGAPGKPIRRMVGLIILKHLRNLSDESIVEHWQENVYYQYFCGEHLFAQKRPCASTELVEFRNRIGINGIELILKESIRINGKDGHENESITDTTVQEKNISYPTDDKLYKKIIAKCRKISSENKIKIRQSYTRTIKKLGIAQRFRNHPKNKSKARKADKKIKIIAGRMLREVERHLAPESKHQTDLLIMNKVLQQQRHDSHKIYSLHEPNVQCISKGKEHKKYEFGCKVSIMSTKNSGVIIGALSYEKNEYDGHTIEKAIEQQQRLTGAKLIRTYVDRGYRGIKEALGTKVMSPKINETDTETEKRKLRKV